MLVWEYAGIEDNITAIGDMHNLAAWRRGLEKPETWNLISDHFELSN